jgi:hypothetical protein
MTVIPLMPAIVAVTVSGVQHRISGQQQSDLVLTSMN